LSKRVCLVSCLVLAFLYIIPTIGVGCTKCEGYKQLSVDEGIAHFSFEYPCNWKIGIVDARHDYEHTYTNVKVFGPDFKRERDTVSSTVWIFFICPTDADTPDASAALEYSLSYWQDFRDFEILERSTVEIAGLQVEQVVFFCQVAGRFYDSPPIPSIDRELYFEYSGLIWKISISSRPEVVEADNVHFEHLLETFRILD